MMFDCDKAAVRCARMWRKIGLALELAAMSAADSGLSERAVALAKAADACFWQATGDGESITLKDLSE